MFDPVGGLYLGEHSFLDWREQSYPIWTKADVVTIATSRSLSTNVVHWAALDAAARLAVDAGDTASAAKYREWADELRSAIRKNFWLPKRGQFSQMLTTELDTAPADRYDALGTALAVITGVANPDQARQAVANYPQTQYGPPVLWPEQQDIPPILGTTAYHNNTVWPFVTAYLLRAAARTGNDGVAALGARSLVRGAAIYGTNKENLNILSGGTDTVANSDRQLWSVAGMMSMVQQSIFGIDARQDGLHVKPFLPAQLAAQYFPGSDRIALKSLDYRGHKLDVELELPLGASGDGAYQVKWQTLDGKRIPAEAAISENMLSDHSKLVVGLGAPTPSPSVPASAPVDTSSQEALYGPATPVVRTVAPTASGDLLQLSVNIGSEDPSKVTMDVLRDGAVIATGVPVSSSDETWVDTNSRGLHKTSYCYSVRLTYKSSGNTGQHAKPVCYWGPQDNRIHTITADAFEVVGGNRTSSSNGTYYENWGTAPGDKITARVTPSVSGDYLLQVDAAIGNRINTGVAAGMKMLRVYDDATNELVSEQVVAMANTGSWSTVRGSTYVKTSLVGDTTYRLELVQDRLAVNMSYFTANASYSATQSGPSNISDVYAIKVMLKRAR